MREPGEITTLHLAHGDLDAMLGPLQALIVGLDADGTITYISPRVRDLLGLEPNEVEGRSVADFMHPDDLGVVLDGLVRWEGRGGVITGPRVRLRAEDGTWLDLVSDLTMGPLADPLGGVISVLRVRSQDSEQEQELRQRLLNEDRLGRLGRTLVHRTPDHLHDVVDEALVEISSLEYVTRLLVYAASGDTLTRVGQWEARTDVPRLPAPEQMRVGDSPITRRLSRLEEITVPSSAALDGPWADVGDELLSRGVVSYLAVPMASHGRFLGFVSAEVTIWEVEFDSTHLTTLRTTAGLLAEALRLDDARRAMRFRSRHDPVTRLSNRAALVETLSAISRDIDLDVHDADGAALIHVDIDSFKLVNDGLGHAAGDALLCHIAARLRSAAPRASVVARVGPGDFACLVSGLGTTDALAVAREVKASLTGSVSIAGHVLNVGTRVGIAFRSDLRPAERTPAGWLAIAEATARNAAASSTSPVAVFDDGVRDKMARRRWIATDLPTALTSSQFELHFQPEIDLVSGGVMGAEALLRWRHPQHGLVAAADFICDAEHRDVFTDVSDWVMSDACSRLHGLDDVVHDQFEMRMNLSSRDVSQGGLRDRVSRALERSQVDPARICLEITESALITNPERAIRSCHDVRTLGVRLAIDDFGTGHWSIRSLAQFPVDVLKLDRSLVSGLHLDDGAKRVVAGLLAFADELGMDVVAEGVEEEPECAALVELGVQRAQGFLFSRPVPLDELRSQVSSRSSWIPAGVAP